MTQPLTFGVEFEFALAYLENDTPLPYSEDVKKILHFHPTLDDWPQNVGTLSKEELLKIARKYAARRHLRNTIREAGFPLLSNEKASEVEADVDKWEVVDDGTVKGPNGSPYSWLSMEIRSPAMYFTSGSLKAVADVLALMSNTFVSLSRQFSNSSKAAFVDQLLTRSLGNSYQFDYGTSRPLRGLRSLFRFIYSF